MLSVLAHDGARPVAAPLPSAEAFLYEAGAAPSGAPYGYDAETAAAAGAGGGAPAPKRTLPGSQ